jgi:hypothetical protein
MIVIVVDPIAVYVLFVRNGFETLVRCTEMELISFFNTGLHRAFELSSQ